VLPAVLEDIDDGLPGLARRAQIVGVVSVGDHAAGAPGHAIELARHAHTESLHGPPEGDLVIRLDEEMEVIGLDREVDDARAESITRPTQGASDGRVDAMAAQIGDAADDARGDMDGKSRLEARPSAMRHLGSIALRLAARPAPATTPGRR
jgi:hypothetical protein